MPDSNGNFRPYTDVKVGLLGGKLDGVASVDNEEVVPNPDQRSPNDWSDDSGSSSSDSDSGEE